MTQKRINGLDPIVSLGDDDYFAVDQDEGGGAYSCRKAKTSDIDADLSGRKTVYIPASAMIPTTTDGCSALLQAETTAGRPDIPYLAFDGSSAENAQFHFPLPKSWDLGTLKFQVYWTGLIAGAGTVSWKLSAVAASDDDTIDVAFGTEIEVVDTFITAEDQHISAESAALTVAGTPADSDNIWFNIQRDPTGDTRTQDANLIGIRIFYNTDTLKDD
jgi:hypothetical protein